MTTKWDNVFYLEEPVSVSEVSEACVSFEEELQHDDRAAAEALRIVAGDHFLSLEAFVA